LSVKAWLMPILPMVIGLAFTVITFVTDVTITDSHVQLLNYLLMLTLGTGSIGVANKGFKQYNEYRKKQP